MSRHFSNLFALIIISIIISCLSAPPASAFVFYFASGGASTGDHQTAMIEIIKSFKQEYPEATLDYDISTSYIRPITETLMQNFGNTTPDVAVAGLVEWPILHKRGLLRRLDSVLSPTELASIWKSILPELTVQQYGKQLPHRDFSLPFNRGIPMMFVNTDLLPELAKKENVTWNDLSGMISKAVTAHPVFKDRLRLGIPLEDWITETVFIGASGETSLRGTKAYYADPNTKAAFAELRHLRDKGGLYLAPTHRQAYDDFIEGKSAATIISSSAYISVLMRVKFPFKGVMPPRFRFAAINIGGGDLVLPDNPNKVMDEKTKKDIRSFITWFYAGKGSALWAKGSSMFPLTRAATEDPAYKEALINRPDRGKITHSGWAIKSFYELDEYCNILKYRQLAQKTFKDAMNAPDPALILTQAEGHANKLLADQQCP